MRGELICKLGEKRCSGEEKRRDESGYVGCERGGVRVMRDYVLG